MSIFFRPKSPVSPHAQEWVEESFTRFNNLPGECDLRETSIILPTDTFFPDPIDGGEKSLRLLFRRVCGYMKVPPEEVDLRLHHQEDGFEEEMSRAMPMWQHKGSGAAGLYSDHAEMDKPIIIIRTERQTDLVSLIATMAHELAHVRLLRHAGFDRDASDMEPLTDLMTVHQGLGIFTANSAFQFRQFSDGDRSGWSTRRLGYLPEETFGYALAFLAYLRDERNPTWAKHLNINIGTYFRQSAKYLQHRPMPGNSAAPARKS